MQKLNPFYLCLYMVILKIRVINSHIYSKNIGQYSENSRTPGTGRPTSYIIPCINTAVYFVIPTVLLYQCTN